MRPLTLSRFLLAAVGVGLPRSGQAQVSITLSGAGTPNVFPAATLAMFNAGVNDNPTGIGFTVNVTGGSTATDRTSIVSIRASSATLGGGKALSDLQWRRSDLVTWNPVTMADVMIESRTVRRNGTNDPWNNTVFFRMLLNWATDAPATYSTGLIFTLTITTP